jgi:hypothetical protein
MGIHVPPQDRIGILRIATAWKAFFVTLNCIVVRRLGREMSSHPEDGKPGDGVFNSVIQGGKMKGVSWRTLT